MCGGCAPTLSRWLHLVCFATLAGGFQLLCAPEAETSAGEFPLFYGGWVWDKSVALVVITLSGVYSAIFVYLPQWRRVPVLNGGRRRYFMALALKTALFVPAFALVYVRPTLTSVYICWFLFLIIFTLALYMKHLRETTLNDNAPGVDANAANPAAVAVHRLNVDSPNAGAGEKRVVLPFKYRKGVCDQTDPAHIRVRSPTAAAAAPPAAPPDDSRGPRYCSYCTSALDIRHDAMCGECAAKYRVCAVCALHLRGTEPTAAAAAGSAAGASTTASVRVHVPAAVDGVVGAPAAQLTLAGAK